MPASFVRAVPHIQFVLNLPVPLRRRLGRAAHAEGRPLSALVRDALVAYLARAAATPEGEASETAGGES